MKIQFARLLAVIITLTVAGACSIDASEQTNTESIAMSLTTDGQVVMFYYKDLSEADYFYGNLLGFKKTLDLDWVKFYQTSGSGTVGLVAEGEGAWHKVQEKNSVMLSIVTSEVDAWYAALKQKDEISFLKEIGDGGPVRSFLMEDPGGYTVEFFQWLKADD